MTNVPGIQSWSITFCNKKKSPWHLPSWANAIHWVAINMLPFSAFKTKQTKLSAKKIISIWFSHGVNLMNETGLVSVKQHWQQEAAGWHYSGNLNRHPSAWKKQQSLLLYLYIFKMKVWQLPSCMGTSDVTGENWRRHRAAVGTAFPLCSAAAQPSD